MKYLLFSVTLFTLFFISSSYRNSQPPNPEEFAKGLVELLKKNEKPTYLKAYLMNTSDLNWIVNQMNSSPFITNEEKENFVKNFGDTTELNRMNGSLERGYSEFEEWVQQENINLNDLEYVQFDYELKYKHRTPFYILDDSELFVKHKDQYYRIRIDESAFINGRWVSGRIKGVDKSDQYLHDEYYGYNEYYGADTTAVAVTEAPPEEEYQIDSVAVIDEQVLTKKQQKLEKKIDAQQKKLWKLIDQRYK